MTEKNRPHRGNYTYDLLGTIQGKTLRKNPQYQQYFYRLSISCENLPKVEKLFVFQSKLTNPQI